MPYAIARLKKLKRSNIAGSASHTARERETPNADPTQNNIRFIGSLDPTEGLEDLVLAKIAEHEQKRKIRTDGVYCVEFLLSASPCYFRPHCPTRAGYYQPQKLDDWLEATHQWLADEYGDRIVRAELHLDEATPHIHAYFVPLDEQGQLRAKHFFDGRQKIHAFQDSYYETMRLIGLERGIKGSRAQHQDIKDFYRIVEQGRDLETDDLSIEQLKAKAADRDRATQRKQEMEATAKALARENEQLKQRVLSLELETQQLRDLPLEDVAWELGLNHDHLWWKGHNSTIDLVKHVNECKEAQAIAWLYDRFGEALVERAALAHARIMTTNIIQAEPRPKFQLRVEDKWNWSDVERYLTQKLGIPQNFVEVMHDNGLVYADAGANAVFAMRDFEGIPQGAFLQGTQNDTFNGYQKGTKRREGWFYFHLGGEPNDKVETVVLCNSPIDVMSIAMLEYQVRGDVPPIRTLYMTVDDPKSLPVEQLQRIPNVTVAFETDQVGEAAARAVKELLPQATRLKCKTANWNQQLIDYGRQLTQHNRQQEEDDLSL